VKVAPNLEVGRMKENLEDGETKGTRSGSQG
jgi:hypothetical protein